MFIYARESKRLLGVDHTHSVAQIKSAFRTCVKKYHPDVLGNTPGSVRYFQHINRVYSELLQYKNTHPDVAPAAEQPKSTGQQAASARAPHRNFNRQNASAQSRPFRRERESEKAPTREQMILKRLQKLQKSDLVVDPLVSSMGVEALIMRCEFSDNYYVKREAIKALIFKGNSEAVKAILYLQKCSDGDTQEIIDELLFQSDARFKRMMEDDKSSPNPFFAWVSKLVSGIARVFDSSVRPTTHP